jgi:hypothetical protein
MPPFPCILQHSTEFDIHTIATLEKLFGATSFGNKLVANCLCKQKFVSLLVNVPLDIM